jgi:hypothetical protein
MKDQVMFNIFNQQPEISLNTVYQKIKSRCRSQQNFSWCLLIIFFILQYSVPIFLVVLGSLTTSRDQLAYLIKKPPNSNMSKQEREEASKIAKEEADILIGKAIFILGIVTIFLGVINSIIKPAESYDRASEFNNKFHKFEQDLDLNTLEEIDKPEEEKIKYQKIIKILSLKNQELFQLINDYNISRSLQDRSGDIASLKESIEELKSNKTLSNNLDGLTSGQIADAQVTSTRDNNQK